MAHTASVPYPMSVAPWQPTSTSTVPGAGCTGSSESQPACLLFTLQSHFQSAGPRGDSCRDEPGSVLCKCGPTLEVPVASRHISMPISQG